MSMFSICQEILVDGKLSESIASLSEAERNFTSEIGVLDRHYFQCIQQPHVIWAYTEWISEKHHNVAAHSIMKVREDDRVASAYFRPGLYFELFARPVEEASLHQEADDGKFVVVAHGLAARRSLEGWEERVATRLKSVGRIPGLQRLRTFRNDYLENEFVAFFEWSDEASYASARMVGERTIEERVFVAEGRSDLASYIQFECLPLEVRLCEDRV